MRFNIGVAVYFLAAAIALVRTFWGVSIGLGLLFVVPLVVGIVLTLYWATQGSKQHPEKR
ncbi:MAG TPA: hypothetical protein VMY79_00740 [Dehalococcoidia bacterium]|nr:hypothetical protein [Dehalococcoidia bacterium]